jgi:hypothetical protein
MKLYTLIHWAQVVFLLTAPGWSQCSPASCTNPSSVWQLQSVSNPKGSIWCPPGGGTPIYKANLLSKTDLSQDIVSANAECGPGRNICCYQEICQKYGGTFSGTCGVNPHCSTLTPWATAISTRMNSLGFTGGGYYSYDYATNWSSGDLPYESSSDFGFNAIRDSGGFGPYHAKDAGYPQPGMHCRPGFQPTTPDPYDPEFPIAFADMYRQQLLTQFNPAHTIFFQADDGDNVGLFNQCCDSNNAHPDGALIIASNNPVQGTSSPTAGGGFTFSNKTYFVKQAMRDWFVEEYLCTGVGTPSGGFCTGVGIGTGSADPASGSYVGSTNAASALTALNAAWANSGWTGYSTWNTSDAGGLAGITAGTYASYGSGTGFLDENGTHLMLSSLSCSGLSGNGIQQNQPWGAVPQIQTDVDHFGAYGLAYTWASEIYTAYASKCSPSNCAPLSFPAYGGPVSPASSSVYAGMASFLNAQTIPTLFWVGGGQWDTAAHFESYLQSLLNNDGNMPVVLGDYDIGQPDSFVFGSPNYLVCTEPYEGIHCQTTQALRGSIYAQVRGDTLRYQNPAGAYPVVGWEHWSLYDSWSQGTNFGVFTDNDNGYDGSAASTVASSGACPTTAGGLNALTIPYICLDANGNYESLTQAGTATGVPVYSATYGGLTTDGTVLFFNQGSYTRAQEAASWGNSLLPMYQMNAGQDNGGHVCDPATNGPTALSPILLGNSQIYGSGRIY